MKITSIKQQEKLKSRYSIFVDGKYGFSLSESALLEQKLNIGYELDRQQLKNFKQLSADDKAYGQALRYVALRVRSVWEMEQYLRRKNVDEPVAEKILNKLSSLDLLNDAAFARAWIQNRRLLKATSKRRLIQELHQKHVADDIIEEVLAEDETDEHETLRNLVTKKRQQSKYQDDLKLMQYLARQGFNYGDIKSAMSEKD